MIDPTFRNIDRLFVESFKPDENDPTRNSVDTHYIPLVEMKNFNALILPYLVGSLCVNVQLLKLQFLCQICEEMGTLSFTQ